MNKNPFEKYNLQSDPDKAQKSYAWQTAIGLQDVDGLKTSDYLVDIAIQHIEGKISISEVQNLINAHYAKKPNIDMEKPNIQAQKPNIDMEKPNFGAKTKDHILKLYNAFKDEPMFAKADVMEILELKSSAAYDLIKKMSVENIIEPVYGHGKGKYKFKI